MSIVWPIIEAVGAAGAVILFCWGMGIVLDHIDEGTD